MYLSECIYLCRGALCCKALVLHDDFVREVENDSKNSFYLG